MLYDILQDEEFATILTNHATDILYYLFEKNQEFSILADLKQVEFNPKLPQNIYEKFPEFILFALMNYTYESARLHKGVLEFEAGFGSENFGAVVRVPVNAILQIIVDETPIFVNLTATIPKRQTRPKSSMEALLSNPENQRFLKKENKD